MNNFKYYTWILSGNIHAAMYQVRLYLREFEATMKLLVTNLFLCESKKTSEALMKTDEILRTPNLNT